jgi:hypothetical protein
VNKAMVSTYAFDDGLRDWGELAQFVLLGPGTPTASLGPENLWTIEAATLADFVAVQGRGTIDPDAFDDLVGGAAARPLLDLLGRWESGLMRPRRELLRERRGWADYRRGLFDLSNPTPIGLMTPLAAKGRPG